jgi:hypothetical protein
MTSLEDRIRAGLDADRAVPDLWDSVQDGARCRRTRRTAGAALAMAAVVVAVIAGLSDIAGWDTKGAPPPPAEQPSGPQQLLDPADWDVPASQFLDGATPKASDLVGLWRARTTDDGWLMLLGADGYWTTTNGWDLFGGGEVGNRGTWSLTGGRLTENVRDGWMGNGARLVWDVALMPDRSLHRVDQSKERLLFDRVAPGDSLLLSVLSSASGSPIDPVLADSYLRGVWASSDGHWVITINETNRFRAYRDNGDPTGRPNDNGHVEIDDHGNLTIACRGGSISAGVVLTLTDPVDGVAPSGIRMHPESSEGNCGSGLGGSLEWIRVSGRG